MSCDTKLLMVRSGGRRFSFDCAAILMRSRRGSPGGPGDLECGEAAGVQRQEGIKSLMGGIRQVVSHQDIRSQILPCKKIMGYLGLGWVFWCCCRPEG